MLRCKLQVQLALSIAEKHWPYLLLIPSEVTEIVCSLTWLTFQASSRMRRCWGSISSASGTEMPNSEASNWSTFSNHAPNLALFTSLPVRSGASRLHLGYGTVWNGSTYASKPERSLGSLEAICMLMTDPIGFSMIAEGKSAGSCGIDEEADIRRPWMWLAASLTDGWSNTSVPAYRIEIVSKISAFATSPGARAKNDGSRTLVCGVAQALSDVCTPDTYEQKFLNCNDACQNRYIQKISSFRTASLEHLLKSFLDRCDCDQDFIVMKIVCGKQEQKLYCQGETPATISQAVIDACLLEAAELHTLWLSLLRRRSHASWTVLSPRYNWQRCLHSKKGNEWWFSLESGTPTALLIEVASSTAANESKWCSAKCALSSNSSPHISVEQALTRLITSAIVIVGAAEIGEGLIGKMLAAVWLATCICTAAKRSSVPP